MPKTFRLSAALGLLCLPAFAQPFHWNVDYRGGRLPEEILAAAKAFGEPDAARIENGSLHLINEIGHQGLWAFWTIRDIGALNSRGVTLEARIKLISSGGAHFSRPGLQLYIADSFCAEALLIGEGYIETKYSVMRHDIDTTGTFHLYRLCARGDDYRVYVDGKLAINGKGRFLGTRTNPHRQTWLDTVRFGGGSRYTAAEGLFDFVRYTTEGAFRPDGSLESFDPQPPAGRKVEIAPVGAVLQGMAAGLNDFDASMPALGTKLHAPILFENETLQLWFQNATTKVFRRDEVLAAEARSAISISMARNEYEPFQIVLRPKQSALKSVKLAFSDLVGKNGIIERKQLRFNPLAFLKIPPGEATTIRGKQIGRPGYWPDGLLPFKSFDALHAGINYPLWITVYCPESVDAGIYRGTVTLSAAGCPEIPITLQVKVRNFSLPRTPRLNNQFLFNNVYLSVEKSTEVYQRMYAELAAHRGSPSRLFPGLKYEIRDGKVWIDPENAKFVQMARYCIDQLGVKHFWFPNIGPHQMLGWFERHRKERRFMGVKMYKDERPYTTFTPEFEKRLIDYLIRASRFLKSKGLFQYFNCLTSHNEPACPPAWKSTRSFAMEARYCDLVHRADPDLQVFMNMGLVVGEPELDRIKDKVSIWAENTLGSKFNLLGRQCLITPGLVAERKAAGDQVLMYRNSHDYVDTGRGSSSMNHRVNGWMLWVTGTTGYYFDNGGISASLWNPNAWRKIGRRWNREFPWGAGDELYPNRNMCGFCSSIRFELNRESYEDYEYLATVAELGRKLGLTEQQRQRLHHFEQKIVPLHFWWRQGKDPDSFWEEAVHEGAFSENPRDTYQAREQIGDLIESLLTRNH